MIGEKYRLWSLLDMVGFSAFELMTLSSHLTIIGVAVVNGSASQDDVIEALKVARAAFARLPVSFELQQQLTRLENAAQDHFDPQKVQWLIREFRDHLHDYL